MSTPADAAFKAFPRARDGSESPREFELLSLAISGANPVPNLGLAGLVDGITPGRFAIAAMSTPSTVLRLRVRNQRDQACHTPMRLDGMPKRQFRVNAVVIPSTTALALDVPAAFEVRDDPLYSTLGDTDLVRDIAKPDLGVFRDQQEHMGVVA